MERRYQDLSQFRLPPSFRGRHAVVVQLWWLVQATLFGLSPQPLYGWRRALLRLFGAEIGPGARIRPTARITYPWKVSVGARSWIGDSAELYSLGEITIGSDTVISQRTYLCTATHDYRDPAFPIAAAAIRIGSEAWIAADVFIAPGVTVGRGAVIGARSTVWSDVPDEVIVYGNPATMVRRRHPDGDGGPKHP